MKGLSDATGLLASLLSQGGMAVPTRDRYDDTPVNTASMGVPSQSGIVNPAPQYQPPQMLERTPQATPVQPPQSPPTAQEGPWQGMLERLLKREGGFKKKDVDRGAVNMGVTQQSYSDYTGREVDEDEIRALSPEKAGKFYKDRFLIEPGYDRIEDDRLQELMFDFGVHSGPRTATKQLQRTLNDLGASLSVDGKLGPKTLEAIKAAEDYFGEDLYNQVLARRSSYLADLIHKNPDKYADYQKGWRRRIEEFRRG